MAENMPKKAQTTAPTSRLMGLGAFLPLPPALLGAAPLLGREFFVFLLPVPLLAAGLLAPPEEDAMFQQSFQKTRERIIVSTPAPRQ